MLFTNRSAFADQSLPPGQAERPPRASAETFGGGVVWAAQPGLKCETVLGRLWGFKTDFTIPCLVVTYQVLMAKHGKTQ
jgi:hypothetical protein